MSGGVDSSVAAHLLLQAGYEVTGVTCRFWTECESRTAVARRTCCSLSDLRDAARVAGSLGIEHLVVDARSEFLQRVVEPFIDAYLTGSTPNPCIVCNRLLKFPELVSVADRLGAEHIATGHYARVARMDDGRYGLRRGADPSKDQSYVLYRTCQPVLARLLFPVGERSKAEVVATARRLGMEVADKQESMDICFLPDGDYRDFLRARRPEAFLPGFILDRQGNILGRHQGIADYTLGQRRGLGVAAHHPLYVIELDPARNAVVVGPREETEMRVVQAVDAAWIAGVPPSAGFAAEVKVRYQMEAVPSRVCITGDDSFEVELGQPVPLAAPGQSVVLYRGDEVLGGGIIAPSFSPSPSPEGAR
jgi:tRNA-specific 2-thiouridylase